MTKLQWLALIGTFAAIAAVATTCSARNKNPIPPVANVDLPRFMGDWYVIAHIPTFIEKDAMNAVESYELTKDGKIQTTYRQDTPSTTNGKPMRPVATVREGSNNAIWGMQFVWPIKAEYVIVYLNEDYTQTIIGRSDRDYVWVMARTPKISDADYAANVERVRKLGYDVAKLRMVPQANAANPKP